MSCLRDHGSDVGSGRKKLKKGRRGTFVQNVHSLSYISLYLGPITP